MNGQLLSAEGGEEPGSGNTRGRVAPNLGETSTWPLLGGNRNSPARSRKPAVIGIHAGVPTASALEIGNHIAGYTDYYAIRI